MISLRAKRERRDRDSGLVFSWRIPVGNGMTIFTSAVIVGLLALGVSSIIRVHVTGTIRQPERRGSFVVLESGSSEAKALELIAQEAGPFPARARPSQSPGMKNLLRQASVDWMPPGSLYQPDWQNVPVTISWSGDRSNVAGTLPPLPDPATSVQPADPVNRPFHPISLTAGVSIQLDQQPPANVVNGSRFILTYDSAGKIVRVASLTPSAPTEKTGTASVEAWLAGATVVGGNPAGGWLPMEVGP